MLRRDAFALAAAGGGLAMANAALAQGTGTPAQAPAPATGGGRPALPRDLATRATRLEPLVLGTDDNFFAMSVREYRLETGRYYRWRITSSGKVEYNIVAPELWRASYIRQVQVGEIEIKTPALEELDFDGPGSVDVFFVPVRTGTFRFASRGMENRGVVGTVTVT